jgi:hypothetical protein
VTPRRVGGSRRSNGWLTCTWRNGSCCLSEATRSAQSGENAIGRNVSNRRSLLQCDVTSWGQPTRAGGLGMTNPGRWQGFPVCLFCKLSGPGVGPRHVRVLSSSFCSDGCNDGLEWGDETR